MSQLRFDGRVAIVTGAGRGLGREHALLLAKRGAKVLVNDIGGGTDMTGRDDGPAGQVVAEIEAAGGTAIANFDTVATREGAAAIVGHAKERWGRVDVVINNAGGGIGASTIDQLAEDDLRRMIDTHLLGAFFVLGAAWPVMVDQAYGRILNTSSAAAFGLSGQYAYSAAKAGVLGLTRSLAIDGLPYGIKANAIMPLGYTRLAANVPIPEVRAWMERTFDPETTAAVAIALVHEDVPFTGQTLSAAAGRAARVCFAGVSGFRQEPLTPELVLENADLVMDAQNSFVINEGSDEMRFLADGPPASESWIPAADADRAVSTTG
jgi:NAD(P)-dependent dehydrogenase (short-subunit alcohol dehydrogenase family)